MTLHIDSELWERMLKIIQENQHECAFYLIGFDNSEKKYVIELFEVLYSSKSSTHIISDPIGRLLISNSLPGGIKILGIAHSHPFDRSESPRPSSIDIELAEEYKGEIIITVSIAGGATAIRFGEGYELVNIVVENFPEDLKIIKAEDLYFVFPWWENDDMIKLRVPRLCGELIYRLYLHSRFDGKKIHIPQYEWFFVQQKYRIPHIAFGEVREAIKNYLLNNSITKKE